MRKVNYSTTINLPIEEVWGFVQDMNNWAPMVKGYRAHEILNEKESSFISSLLLFPVMIFPFYFNIFLRT